MQRLFTSKAFSFCALLVLLLFFSACSVTKRLPEGSSLLVKNKIVLTTKLPKADQDKIKEDLSNIVAQKPNRRFLGFLPFRMWMYQSVSKAKKLTKFKQWIIDKVGERPAVYDTTYIDRSNRMMVNYLNNYGYFYAAVEDSSITKGKKTTVVYTVHTGDAWKIRNITFPNGKSVADSLIKRTNDKTLLKTNTRFEIGTLKAERERMEAVLRNNGFFFFNREYITFDLDTAVPGKKVDIKLTLNQPSDTTYHERYYINNVNIYTDAVTDVFQDTLTRKKIVYNDYNIISRQSNLRENILVDAVAIKKNDLFSRDKETRSINRLSLLGIYKFINVDFERTKDSANKLDVTVRLTPAKKQAISASLEANVTNEGLFGTAGTLSYKNKNLSRRADQFLIDVSSGVQLKFSRREKVQLITTTASASFTYYINRFVPFKIGTFSKFTTPKTRLNLNYNFEYRNDFDTLRNVVFLYQLHNFSFSYGYEWNINRFKRHQFNPLSISFYLIPKRGVEFNQRLENNPILKSSFEEQIIIGPNYTYTYSNQRTDKDRRYMFFRSNIDMAGSVLYAGFKLANLKSQNVNTYFIFDRPFAQYFKVEGDFRNYFRIRQHGMFAVRAFAGVGAAFGNSLVMPFVKQFFVGGPNSLRGFLIREIGPGAYADASYDRETGEKTNVGFFNQSGDLKLELNAEFRFDIYKWLKGAVFMDAGNVWMLRPDTRELANFDFKRSFKEFAVDAGAGVRLDFNFFVIRLDYGFPLRDPRRTEENRWQFKNAQAFKTGQFQLAIGYPF